MTVRFETARFRNMLQGRDLDSLVTVEVTGNDYECQLEFAFPSGEKATGNAEELLICIAECQNMGDWEELQTICRNRDLLRP